MEKHDSKEFQGDPASPSGAASVPSGQEAGTAFGATTPPIAEDMRSFRITPKGVIFITLGGYSTPGAKEATDKVMDALSKYMGDGSTAIVKYVNGSLGWENVSCTPPPVERVSWWRKLFPAKPLS